MRITDTELLKAGSSSPKHNMFTSSKYPTLKLCKDDSIFCMVCLNKGNLGLEQALRNFTVLPQGDIIEISYNSIIWKQHPVVKASQFLIPILRSTLLRQLAT